MNIQTLSMLTMGIIPISVQLLAHNLLKISFSNHYDRFFKLITYRLNMLNNFITFVYLI